jgi:hypothetical protein
MKEVRELVKEDKTVSIVMSKASEPWAMSLLSSQGITTITCQADPIAHNDKDFKEWPPFSWTQGEKEDTEKARKWLQERMLEEEDKDELGIFDVTSYALPAVKGDRKTATGRSDLAVGDIGLMKLSIENTDAPFSFTNGLIELKTDKTPLKVGQNLLQIVALSMASSFGTGVSLLATDCKEKWEVYSFSSYRQIQRKAGYKDGKQACKDFMQLIKTVNDRKFEASRKAQLEGQGHEQDLDRFEIPTGDKRKAKVLEDEDTLERFADYLGDIYGERPIVPRWARAEARCPDYFT